MNEEKVSKSMQQHFFFLDLSDLYGLFGLLEIMSECYFFKVSD